MNRFGLRDYLSPSAVGMLDRCEYQYMAFRTSALVPEGVKRPFDAALAAKQENHKVVLEDDLGYRILTGHNRADKELSEIYRADMESNVLAIAKEDPNLEQPPQTFIEEKISYFDQILTATHPFRHETIPLEVEHQVNFTLGGIPIESRLDLISNNGEKRVEDLKVQGQSPPEGSAAKTRQLVVYSAGTGIPEVGLVAVVENKKPVVKIERGTVTPGEVERVKRQFQAAAFKIENALKSGIFAPVDHSDKARAWICSKKFCGIWPADARDLKTGTKVGCPFGERSQVRA